MKKKSWSEEEKKIWREKQKEKRKRKWAPATDPSAWVPADIAPFNIPVSTGGISMADNGAIVVEPDDAPTEIVEIAGPFAVYVPTAPEATAAPTAAAAAATVAPAAAAATVAPAAAAVGATEAASVATPTAAAAAATVAGVTPAPQCPICFDELAAPYTTVLCLPCGHTFHLNCIQLSIVTQLSWNSCLLLWSYCVCVRPIGNTIVKYIMGSQHELNQGDQPDLPIVQICSQPPRLALHHEFVGVPVRWSRLWLSCGGIRCRRRSK